MKCLTQKKTGLFLAFIIELKARYWCIRSLTYVPSLRLNGKKKPVYHLFKDDTN